MSFQKLRFFYSKETSIVPSHVSDLFNIIFIDIILDSDVSKFIPVLFEFAHLILLANLFTEWLTSSAKIPQAPVVIATVRNNS
jgi:hypothetical protein